MFDAVDFWLDRGVDGLRLDAIPYLYEQRGTNCENLPATHAFLKDLRRHVDEKYSDRMLLAEANQWPEDAAEYFGDGDECHMNFHFPLMPRLYMAVEREDRFPIIDILEQTPPLPNTAQWAIFLRNHDELTLEMVTDEERDYMYRAYGEDPQSRVNLGIRRRLAPLLRNNRRKMELMNGLLLSLPGTPVIYYGDELGMGDNIYLGDRDGVRTPMQWNPDRNAGFSSANPQRLYLPVVIDTEHHYSAVNVEVEQNSPHSLLWWMRRIIHLRKQYQVFGRGRLDFLHPDNSKVLAFIREYADETVLIVANLSRFTQCAQLDLSRFRGQTPIELFGHTQFPPIGKLPYFLTLAPYAFYWFRLKWRDEESGPTMDTIPRIAVEHSWNDVFSGSRARQLEAVLPAWLARHRWYGGKARTVSRLQLEDILPISNTDSNQADGGSTADEEPLVLAVALVEYTEGEPERYLLPLIFAAEVRGRNIIGDHPRAALAIVEHAALSQTRTLCEAVWEAEFWQPFLEWIERETELPGQSGVLAGHQADQFAVLRKSLPDEIEPTVHGGQQSNTSAIYGDRLILKLFRRLAEGVNPDLEIARFFTTIERSAPVPPLAGSVEYRPHTGEPMTLAFLQEFVANEGDAWVYTLDELGRYFERISLLRGDEGEQQPVLPDGTLLQAARGELPPLAHDVITGYLESVELLGRRTAEMHLALSAPTTNSAFIAEPFTKLYQRSLYQSMRTGVRRVMNLLRKQAGTLDETLRPLADRVLKAESALNDRFKRVLDRKISAQRIRCHGDYHLGQVLYTGRDFIIIDFEGEPDRTASERRIKQSPLKDVAGMLRSFHYASYAARFGDAPGIPPGADTQELIGPWMDFWSAWCSATYLKHYLETAADGGFLPADDGELETLLGAYVLEKAVYELGYELNNRPDWVRIPLEAILQMLDTDHE